MQVDLSILLENTQDVVVERGRGRGLPITSVCSDSRKAIPGSLFVALPGSRIDGSEFVSDAVARGAVAVFVPDSSVDDALRLVPDNVAVLSSRLPNQVLGHLASAFYGHPSHSLEVIGITGTNGKTTCSFLIEKILQAAGHRPGLSGTICQKTGTAQHPSSLTTPDAVSFQEFLAAIRDEGCTHAVTEVSSHGLVQGRVAGCRFRAAVFTNLSHDHLDYHKDMESYFQAKKLLFSACAPEMAVINIDDPYGGRLLKEYRGAKVSFGLSEQAMVRPDRYELDINGIKAMIKMPGQVIEIRSSLIGLHNLSNILAATAVAYVLGIEPGYIRQGIQALRAVPGRLEPVEAPRGITALVDYAHTPDALQNVLSGLREFVSGRLIVVSGCGGDRDRTKRPEMARIAARLADLCVFTSDNPRSESPGAIIQDMLNGIENVPKAGVKTIVNREAAIKWAAEQAMPGDILLVAGKGHEDYQLIGGRTIPFDDRKVLSQAFRDRKAVGVYQQDRKFLFSMQHVADATGGQLVPGSGDALFSSISTDSRTIRPGELFWAIRGERFDGHAFLAAVADKGAAGAVVEWIPSDAPEGFPLVRVTDSLYSLGEFARWYRKQLGFKVFGITGSCGKTTTKELVASVLSMKFTTAKTKGNLNNLIGLPFTILKISPDTEWAVLEMGTNQPGEISRLCHIAVPDAGLITCIQPVHLEGLGTVDNIAAEKSALLEALPASGTAVINMDDKLIRSRMSGLKCNNIVGFSCRSGDIGENLPQMVRLISARQATHGLEVDVDVSGQVLSLKTRLMGRINSFNIVAAVASGVALGLDLDLIKKGIEKVRPAGARMNLEQLQGGWLLLDDSYNANPVSMQAAIETMGEIAQGISKILILGSMLELGPMAPAFHEQVGEVAAMAQPDILVTVGSLARHLASGAIAAGLREDRILSFDDREQCLEWLAGAEQGFFNGNARAVLVKGSRGIGLERIAGLIRQRVQDRY